MKSDNLLIDLEKAGLWALVAIILLPPLLDLAEVISVNTPNQWLVYDYLRKSSLLGVMFLLPGMRRCIWNSFGTIRRQYEATPMLWLRIGAIVMFASLLEILQDVILTSWVGELLPDISWMEKWRIEAGFLRFVDLTFGLALTAVAEEFIFRSLAMHLLQRVLNRPWFVIIVSSCVFGIFHLPYGLLNVATASIAGMILMVVYMQTKSIIPSIITHYLINVWYFS